MFWLVGKTTSQGQREKQSPEHTNISCSPFQTEQVNKGKKILKRTAKPIQSVLHHYWSTWTTSGSKKVLSEWRRCVAQSVFDCLCILKMMIIGEEKWWNMYCALTLSIRLSANRKPAIVPTVHRVDFRMNTVILQLVPQWCSSATWRRLDSVMWSWCWRCFRSDFGGLFAGSAVCKKIPRCVFMQSVNQDEVSVCVMLVVNSVFLGEECWKWRSDVKWVSYSWVWRGKRDEATLEKHDSTGERHLRKTTPQACRC